jgi:hypothetical protein
MNIGEAFQFLEYLANKTGSGGYIQPEQRTMYAQQAEMEFFSTYYNNVKQYSRGDKTPLFGYADTQRVDDNLRPYMTLKLLQPNADGIDTLPSDYLHPTGFFATYKSSTSSVVDSIDCGFEQNKVVTAKESNVEVKILMPDTFGIRLNSASTPPTLRYPIAKMEGNTVTIAPSNTYKPTLSYLRKPTGAVYAYTLNESGDPIYNPTLSKDWEAPADCHIELVIKMLGYVGIHVRDNSVSEYAAFKNQSGT